MGAFDLEWNRRSVSPSPADGKLDGSEPDCDPGDGVVGVLVAGTPGWILAELEASGGDAGDSGLELTLGNGLDEALFAEVCASADTVLPFRGDFPFRWLIGSQALCRSLGEICWIVGSGVLYSGRTSYEM